MLEYPKPGSELEQRTGALEEHMVATLKDLLLSFGICRSLDVEGSSGGKPVQLLLYFDEAESLAQPVEAQAQPPTGTYYHVLLRCINAWVKDCPDVLVVFLSTYTKLHDLAPSAEYVPSDRYKDHSKTLPAPIVETPFDCSPQFPLRGQVTLGDVTSLEYIAQFGRPL